ncbi:MAG TPA: tripartite tricarboxylate transporter substrate-binding protein [Ramlibacter sp.]
MLSFTAGAALAQGKEGRIIVGNQPGGATDIVARLVAPRLAQALGHPFVVENKAGASGNIAADAVAKAPPDGNTLLLVFNSHPMIGALFPKLPFDPIKDFASIGLISQSPYLVVAKPDIGVEDLKQAVERSKQTKKPLFMGSPGRATPQHLMMERLRKEEGVDVEVVHYKGTGPAIADVMGGHADFTMATISAAGSHVKANKVKLLAVTADKRLGDFPNAPTASELGLKSIAGSGVWVALLAPAKTPPAVVERLNRILNDALKTPEVAERLASIGMTSLGGKPQELDRLMLQEQKVWSSLIRELKITPE